MLIADVFDFCEEYGIGYERISSAQEIRFTIWTARIPRQVAVDELRKRLDPDQTCAIGLFGEPMIHVRADSRIPTGRRTAWTKC